ncbi:MAG: histidine kinase [Rhizobacter sp.]|nr:histidine kinase [Rhizobacter sp.]
MPDLFPGCESEPIHIPGAIQPHGHLFTFNAVEVITYVSERLPAVLGLTIDQVLGHSIASIFGDANAVALRQANRVSDGGPDAEDDSLLVELGGDVYEGYSHLQDDTVLVELEKRLAPDSFHGQLLARTLKRLQRATDKATLFDVAVTEMRRFSGFDRVVVYRFAPEGHGEVLAESRDDAMAAYLGLRFPASDIPVQARELYKRNWMRSIPDVDYEPVAIIGLAGSPALDMSFSTLRSVSPVHRAYMRVMGVRASMSVSLIKDGELWGLLSCGHRTTNFISREVRTACLSIGRLLSIQISALETLRDTRVLKESMARLAPLVELMRMAPDEVLDALNAAGLDLLDVVDATGVAVVIEQNVSTFGVCPAPHEVLELAHFAQSRTGESGLYSTVKLSADFEPAAAYTSVASGLLTLALPKPVPNAVLWFRPEVAQSVTWAGEPGKLVMDTAQGPRFGPRHSFEMWKSIVSATSDAWTTGDLFVAQDLRRAATEFDLANQVRRALAAVASRDELVSVVTHDLRSPLMVVTLQATLLLKSFVADGSATSRRLFSAATTITRAATRMSEMLADLLDLGTIEQGRFQLVRAPHQVATLFEDALTLLLPIAEAKHLRLTFACAPGLVVAVDSERVYQVLANLVGNAVKFTDEHGSVSVDAALSKVDKDLVEFNVMDTGQGMSTDTMAHVFERYWLVRDKNPRGTGLGLYIAKGLVEAHGGTIAATSQLGVGSCFTFTLPTS